MEAVGMVKGSERIPGFDQCSPVLLRTNYSSGPPPKFLTRRFLTNQVTCSLISDLFHVGLMF